MRYFFIFYFFILGNVSREGYGPMDNNSWAIVALLPFLAILY